MEIYQAEAHLRFSHQPWIFAAEAAPSSIQTQSRRNAKLGLEDADSTHSFFFCCPKSQSGERGELAAVLCACARVLPLPPSAVLRSQESGLAPQLVIERARERGTVGRQKIRVK